jgi:hypothetical protein
MTRIQQELAQLQADFNGLMSAWNGLSRSERGEEWSRYLELTDEGGAGWHRFAGLLINCYCEGWCPLGGLVRNDDGELAPVQLAAA